MLNQPEDDDFFEEISNEFELIKFSDEVQNAIEQVKTTSFRSHSQKYFKRKLNF